MKPKGTHPDKALNALMVRNTTKPGRYADGNGLYLVVTKAGSKKWIWRSVIHGKRREFGLGGAAKVSLAKARSDALKLSEWNHDGKDVMAEWRQEKNKNAAPTFKEAAEAVHAEHKLGWKNKNHIEQWIGTLERFAIPSLGSKRIDHIQSGDVLAVLSPIWLEKPETARRVRQRIRTVFDWAKAKGYRSGDNPVEGVSKALPRQRDQVNQAHLAALPYAQVPALVVAIRDAKVMDATRFAMEFTILTAARTGEVILARKSEFDLDAKEWTIPAKRMKAGRIHRAPLTKRCVELVKAALKLSDGSEYVFPGSITGKPLSNVTMLKALKDMGYSVTVHGFRSSFRDWAAERTNYPRDVVEMALAHTHKDKTEAAYKRTDLFEKRRELMDTWAAFVAAKTADVITLNAGKATR